MTNPTTKADPIMTTTIVPNPHGGFILTVDGYTAVAPTLLAATVLADVLANDIPEGVDADAWRDHYIDEIWPDTDVMIADVPTDIEPVHYLFAAQSLGLLTLPEGWHIDAWHPTGVHMWNPLADIVITGWNDDDRYTVGVYCGPDHEFEEAREDHDPLTDDLIDVVRDIFARRPWIGTDPLPAPVCVATLAARYIANARTDIMAMADVAGAGEQYGGGYPAVGDDTFSRHHHIWDIGCEIEESAARPLSDEARIDAALIAINDCRTAFGLSTWSA